MTKRKLKTYINITISAILALSILSILFCVVLKPVILNYIITHSVKYARGRFVCTLDNNGSHVGKLYKLNNRKKTLVKTTVSNSCIFSRPKINAGFFVLAIGGGGGATPYEDGNPGQLVSKYKTINSPVVVVKIGAGGNGTYIGNNHNFVDAKDGSATTISEIGITAKGGLKSSRMTPLGTKPPQKELIIPEKYYYLYDISKSSKYGQGGQRNSHEASTAKAPSGQNGTVIIQW